MSLIPEKKRLQKKGKKPIGSGKYFTRSRFSLDVTAAMLMYRTIAKMFFWRIWSIIMQNLSDILPLLYTQTWPSHKVSEKQEY